MANALEPQIESMLNRLESIWIWKRKKLAQLVQATDAQAVSMEADYQMAVADLEQTNFLLSQQAKVHQDLLVSHGQLKSTHNTLIAEQARLQDVHDQLLGETAEIQGQFKQSQSDAADLKLRLGLVQRILGSEPPNNPALEELQQWLSGPFVQAVQQLNLPSDLTAHAMRQAHAIGRQMELLDESPVLRDKFLVAVAGGFSSGKSSFVSSFMSPEASSLLATGIEPVTAIPTYVMPGEHLTIRGHNYKGASVPLDKKTFAQLTHDFLATLGFDLKEIMPFVVIEAPMPQVRPMPKIEHMAFIDMPGYDAAASATTRTIADRKAAAAAMEEADAVIWLVGADTNGTLPAEDLRFLLDHAHDKPLYLILNKADQRPLEHLQAVLRDLRNLLDDHGLGYEGICAYSSVLGEELSHIGHSMADVFERWNYASSAAAAVHKEFEFLMDRLDTAAQAANETHENEHALVHSLGLDIYEISTHLPAEAVRSEDSLLNRARSLQGMLTKYETGENAEIALHLQNANRSEKLCERAEAKISRLKSLIGTLEPTHVANILAGLREYGGALLRRSRDDSPNVSNSSSNDGASK